MRSQREQPESRMGNMMERLPGMYMKVLGSEEMRVTLGLGEKGSVGELISATYDGKNKRVVFNLNLKRLNVMDMKILRDLIIKKTPRVLLFDTTFEADGKWYLKEQS